MTYEEFEWHLLRMVYEEGVKKLSPSYLGYVLKLPHDTISSYLEQAVDSGILEPVASGMGAIEYVVPGVELHQELPTPLWKQAQGLAPEHGAELGHDPSDVEPPPGQLAPAEVAEVELRGQDRFIDRAALRQAEGEDRVCATRSSVHRRRGASLATFRLS